MIMPDVGYQILRMIIFVISTTEVVKILISVEKFVRRRVFKDCDIHKLFFKTKRVRKS
jgi:hypothetical protein